ncbi:MAG: hypothetical protein U1A27_05215 [Phycisphaerae bacterium]
MPNDKIGRGGRLAVVATGETDDFHAGAAGGLDANRGVFDYHAAGWRDRQPRGGEQKHFRIGLSALHVGAGDNSGELRRVMQAVGDQRDVGGRAGRADRQPRAGAGQLARQLGGAGHERDATADQVAIERFLAIGEALHIGIAGCAEEQAHEVAIGQAEAAGEGLVGDGPADFVGKQVPALQVSRKLSTNTPSMSKMTPARRERQRRAACEGAPAIRGRAPRRRGPRRRR